MKLKSFLKRLILVEEIIDRLESPINGEILVYEDLFGKHSMRIGGVSQSGGLVVNIWACALREILNTKYNLPANRFRSRRMQAGIQNTLILGLGAGGSAKLVSEKWPGAKITGIEIDPVVIEVGKKYFSLDKIPNLKIIIGDAINPTSYPSADSGSRAVSRDKLTPTSFDLILIDLYLGQNFPEEAGSEKFINGLKNILNENGIIIFNRYNWGKYKKQAADFKKELEKYFSQVWTKKTISNLLIFCQG